MKLPIKIIISILVAVALFILSVSILPVKKLLYSSYYKSFTSPDKNHRIDLYGYKNFGFAMPGSAAGDEPGYIRLYNKENVMLNEKEIEMIQLVETVNWTKETVHIKLIANWKLQ